MKSSQEFLGAALAAAVLGCSAATVPAFAATNLITDGDFSPASAYQYGVWGLYSSVNGWTNNGDDVEVGLNSTYGLPCDGAICTNLEVNADQFGDVSQLVTLTPGDKYNFTFDYGGRPGGGVQELDVMVDGTVLNPSSLLTGSYGIWTGEHYVFTATALSETIEFKSLDTSAMGGLPSYGNEITNVSVAAVPEPATWALMLAGFGAMGVALRSRRRIASAA